MNNKVIEIILQEDIPDTTLFYIADCWVEFVQNDLGYEPKDLLMILPL